MADLFDDDDLGGLLGDDDDILSLLETIQNKQDKGETITLPEAKDDQDDPTAVLGVSEEAFQRLMGDIDLDDLMGGAAEEEHVASKSIDDYDKSVYGYPQLDEIEKGIKRGLDVSLYDSAELSFRQMREIRIGLEHKVDVSYYTSKYYKDTQMREIRLGLMQELDVSSYARLIYSLPDMQRIHADLLKKKYQQDPNSLDFSFNDADTGINICTMSGCMEAYVMIKKPLPDNFDKKKLQVLLGIYGITNGLLLDEEGIDPRNLKVGDDIQVARGVEPIMGEDGWYEYFVDDEEVGPHVNEDGSIDYMAQRKFSYVQPGQIVALYHPATTGKMGMNVIGMELLAVSGKNLPRLSLENIRILDDGLTYVSKKEGLVSVKNGILNIVEQLEFKGDVGYGTNVSFEGDIHVRGSVLESAILQAGGDIIIDGSVEAAIIKAGGDVVIKRGMNPDGKGELEAGGNVVAAFFENANIVAGGNVEADYILNSNVFCKNLVSTRGRKNLICGGKIVSGEGIQTGTVGNVSGTRTELEVGTMSAQQENFIKLRKRRKELTAEMDKVRDGMNMVLRKVGALNGRTNPVYLKLQDVLEQQKKELAMLDDVQAKMDEEMNNDSKVSVRVTYTTYRNTKMVINGNAWLVDKDIERSRFFARGRGVSFEDLNA